MSQAIEKHITEHITKAQLPITEECSNKIRESLIVQVLEKAAYYQDAV
jgi:hypothetical protein